MNKIKAPTLDARLSAAADLVRPGAVLADIGTDHAYIPIFLLLAGTATRALACDIREGPLDRARSNAHLYGLESKIGFFLTDGLKGLPLHEEQVTDIVICGMGGELIAAILKENEYIRNPAIRLILQPMSTPAALRQFLSEQGFAFTEERVTRAGGKLYQCIAASFDGQARKLSPAQCLLGPLNIDSAKEDTPFADLLRQQIFRCNEEYLGRRKGGKEDLASRALLQELITIAKTKGVSYECSGIL